MGMWQVNRCPRCYGRLFIDNDEDGWYEQCLNCSYRHELKVSVDLSKTTAAKYIHNNVEILRSSTS
jgi:hypothetical protein